ncbi:hypothetical protein BvCmsOUNP001_00944 [Escherichia coli]|nr:hypothetical protein BvCmsOUNP001_00944 [Escherichia coli]
MVQGVALPQQQFAVQSFILITGKLHLNQLRFTFRQQGFCHFRHMIQHLKRGRRLRMGQHTEAVLKITVQLHIAYRT